MSSTRKKWEEAFLHVAQNVLLLSSPETAVLIESGFGDVIAFVNMFLDTDLEELQHRLSATSRDRVYAFLCLHDHLLYSEQCIRDDKGWLKLSHYDLDDF